MTRGEERAVREEVAVRLVLHLPERRHTAPLVSGAREESDRVLRQVVLGVGDDQARNLGEGQDHRHRGDCVQPPAGQRFGGRELRLASVRA